MQSFDRFRRWLTFNGWYFRRPPWDTGMTPPEVFAFLQSHPPGHALDLGCGTGQNLLALAQAGWQVTGYDFAIRAVRQARRRLRQAGLPAQIYLGDVTDLRLSPGPFNLILDVGCYHGLPQDQRAIYRENVRERLAPGGSFLLYAHLDERPDPASPAVTEPELQIFSQQFSLRSRTDTTDRWDRQTVWLEFTLPMVPGR